MKRYFIKCGKLFDGINLELQENVNILVEGEMIEDMGRYLPCPEDAEVIDLSHLTVTPGLIDAHSHLEHATINAFPDLLMTSDETRLLNMLKNAEESLKRGFTTLRLVGVGLNGYGSAALKDAIDKKQFDASRLVVAPHALGTTNSHIDFSTWYRHIPYIAEAMETANINIGNGADYFKKQVRKEVKYGADFIKIMATGGFATPHDGPYDIQLDDDELHAILDTAKMCHCPVTAHAYGPELIQKLVRFGITCIEHASLADRETLKMMEDYGVCLVPTFWPMEDVMHPEENKAQEKSAFQKRKEALYGNQLRESRQLILEANLKKGYGTDLIGTYHNYEHWVEFTSWRKSGVGALETLRAATSINAEICNRNDIGSIVPGKVADIAAWHRDIMTDIEAIRECDFVMKEGRVIEI